MAAGVEGERPLSHGTGACAHAARDAVERDAALRLELEDPQAHPPLRGQGAERLAEETAPVARPRVHQKVGPRLTCQRNAKVLSPGAKSRALSQRFTASGTSKRIVQASSFT